jgi:hypothetical protein
MVMGVKPTLALVVGWRDAAGDHQEPYTLQAF